MHLYHCDDIISVSIAQGVFRMEKLTIYHGSINIIEKPVYHGGKAENDYGFGFYCTENLELAKEWACSNSDTKGYANKYTINIEGLNILDLTDKKYSILNWMAILLKHRNFDLNNETSIEARDYLIRNFYIDVEQYDVVIGYRADDSYFKFAKDFVNNTISVQKLGKAMELGQLGNQVVIISQKAFDCLNYVEADEADSLIYYPKRKARDEKAREDYSSGKNNKEDIKNALYVIDIIRKGLKNGDKII